MSKIIPTLSLALFMSCSSEAPPPAEPEATSRTVAMGEHIAQCGCTIDGINQCGNYVMFDGTYVEIANWEALELGHMEWCKDGEVRIQTGGAVEDGVFTATSVQTLGKAGS